MADTFKEKFAENHTSCVVCENECWIYDRWSACNSILVICMHCGYKMEFDRGRAIAWDGTSAINAGIQRYVGKNMESEPLIASKEARYDAVIKYSEGKS